MMIRRQIPEIMEDFDFEKVLRVMHFLGWKWRGRDVTLQELRNCAQDLMYDAVDEYELEPELAATGSCVATGGFVAEVVTFAQAAPRMQLTFYVDQKTGRVE
jgi:hypothetical protein